MTKLNYIKRKANSEDTIVFLHGFMGCAENFFQIFDLLNQTRFGCIAFDLPGHGMSLFSDSNKLDILDNAADVGSLVLQDLSTLNINKFHLYGYSMGGRIAQQIAISAENRVKSLILESASFGIEDKQARKQRYEQDRALLSNIHDNDSLEKFLVKWHKNPLFASLNARQVQMLIAQKKKNSTTELTKALKIMSVGNQPCLLDRLSSINIPIHLFCGSADIKYMEIAQTGQNRLLSASIYPFKNASHNIHMQYPESVCEMLLRAIQVSIK